MFNSLLICPLNPINRLNQIHMRYLRLNNILSLLSLIHQGHFYKHIQHFYNVLDPIKQMSHIFMNPEVVVQFWMLFNLYLQFHPQIYILIHTYLSCLVQIFVLTHLHQSCQNAMFNRSLSPIVIQMTFSHPDMSHLNLLYNHRQ